MRKLWMAAAVLAVLFAAATSLSAQGTVPAGTTIVMSLDQSVSSKDAQTGQKLDCSVAQDVVADGKTVIPKGSRCSCSVASVQASGRLSTPAKLYIKIDSVEVHGKTHSVSANWAGRSETSKAKRDTVAIGGGAGAGAIIGAIAGGGKGAAIGAAAGAGAGTAGAAITGKKDITFPAETKLRFTTKASIAVK